MYSLQGPLIPYLWMRMPFTSRCRESIFRVCVYVCTCAQSCPFMGHCLYFLLSVGGTKEGQSALLTLGVSCAAAKSRQSYPTLCDPMDCSLPGFSIRGILQARTLEWVAISFSILPLAFVKNKVKKKYTFF